MILTTAQAILIGFLSVFLAGVLWATIFTVHKHRERNTLQRLTSVERRLYDLEAKLKIQEIHMTHLEEEGQGKA